MNTETPIRTATCVCQNLNVECKGEPVSVSLCSCKDCQRRTGSAFGIAAFFTQDNAHTFGKRSCYSRKSESGYEFSFYFCPDCGSTVYWETTRKPGYVAIAAGSFADPNFPAPTQAVFEEHQHPWLHLSLWSINSRFREHLPRNYSVFNYLHNYHKHRRSFLSHMPWDLPHANNRHIQSPQFLNHIPRNYHQSIHQLHG